MSDKITEGLRFQNTDRGIIQRKRNEQGDQVHDSRLSLDELNNPMYGLGQRRRLGTIAAATAAVVLATTGGLMLGKETQNAIQNHEITPTTIEIGKLTLKDNVKLFITNVDPETGQITQIPWDQITLRGIKFDNYQDVYITNAPIRETPEPGNPYKAYVILKDAQLGGKITDLEVAYDDPNLGHSLDKGFADIGSLKTTPEGKYQATYQGKTITPDQIGIVTPGQPKK